MMLNSCSDSEAYTSYTLPSAPPMIPRRPAKPPSHDTESVEPEILASLPVSTTAAVPITTQTTAKRRAPDDGDVSLGNENAKRQKIVADNPVVVGDGDDDVQIIE